MEEPLIWKPGDEIPELGPSTEGKGNSCNAPPAHQEQQAQQMDSAVPWTKVGDYHLPAWKTKTAKNTFLELESECGAESPRRASEQGYHDFTEQPCRAEPKPKEFKKTFPDLQSRTEKQSIKSRWEDALQEGHKDWANVQPVLNPTPVARKEWMHRVEDRLGQSVSLGRQDHLKAKGVCCYCRKICINTVAMRCHRDVGFLLSQYGLKIVLEMDWSNLATLPKELCDEIYEEMPETCPHFNLRCPSGKCPAETTQCHLFTEPAAEDRAAWRFATVQFHRPTNRGGTIGRYPAPNQPAWADGAGGKADGSGRACGSLQIQGVAQTHGSARRCLHGSQT